MNTTKSGCVNVQQKKARREVIKAEAGLASNYAIEEFDKVFNIVTVNMAIFLIWSGE